ncbi:phosphoesterase RecJ domain-containing protein [Fervidobacterium changbaicum]|uniref:Bifunctional oligoribonuclease/PAP phosphatase NrnA n=2 Tax=Fervidobacterium TaxID=2422 RepID=A0AAI8GD06_FERIS|nr:MULTISPECIES: bifunctional oligoribonuclease/PAP phosphatase NrnA [Fervidobacterium]AMW32499.1 bifunctional oligoribonuclease/PAP phosphatase NrnA [Fervidobacterium islandicum]QAV32659.1 bifunctional oligoribonuclease/PAP phosphatase NrnA [Fervidobacterium changbaicum]SDH43080.1 phosphoesterase RecJ domain-containing protein [Fervidobacterium changbaicum]
MNRDFLSIVGELSLAKKILVVGHIMPDGDDISSVLSAALGLRRLGKEVMSGIDWRIPWYFYEFEETNLIKSYDEIIQTGFQPDFVLVLDASSPDRIGRFQEFLKKINSAVVDHHGTNTLFGTLNWVDTKFGSTAQMVLRLNTELGVPYDGRLATINLMGIATDTGFFRYSNADEIVFSDATKLVSMGGKSYLVSRIFENKRIEQFKLLSTMVEHIQTENNGQIVYSYLSKKDYESNNCTEDDSGGFVGELRSIQGVELAIFLSEYEHNEVHISFRSKDWFDCSKLAVLLGGGGHPRAAGCTLKGELPVIIEEVIREAKIMYDAQLKALEGVH